VPLPDGLEKVFYVFLVGMSKAVLLMPERVLITAAPHTSNWDAVFGIAAVLGLNVRLHFLGKHTIFVPGLKWFMHWLGGIPC
jgi:1-acyl-sn-glycerol-3-phosphate acyltransferase